MRFSTTSPSSFFAKLCVTCTSPTHYRLPMRSSPSPPPPRDCPRPSLALLSSPFDHCKRIPARIPSGLAPKGLHSKSSSLSSYIDIRCFSPCLQESGSRALLLKPKRERGPSLIQNVFGWSPRKGVAGLARVKLFSFPSAAFFFCALCNKYNISR